MEKLFAKQVKILTGLNIDFKNNLYYNLAWNEQLVGIIGARGVGKTTLMLQYIKENYKFSKEALYISFDSLAFSYNSLYELAEEFVKQGGKHLFVDEIHKYPNWSLELKDIYDSLPELKVLFSGSSILEIYKGQADLSRRALIFEMNGLSFREYLEIQTKQKFEAYKLTDILEKHEQIAISIYQKIKPFEYFDDYLKYGYYPFFLQGTKYYSVRLSNTINQIIEVDMAMLLNIDFNNISKLKRFINILSNDIPQTPNITALAAAVGVSWQTIIKFLNYLHKAKIINVLEHNAKNITSLSKPEKIYLQNTNLFYVFKDKIENKGSLRETFFVNQLSYKHKIDIPKNGDFFVDKKYTFEIGGKNKKFDQIANIENSFVVADDIEFGYGNKIPLWLFGFLY